MAARRFLPALAAFAALAAAAQAPAPLTAIDVVRAGHTRFDRVERTAIPGSPGRHTYETLVTFIGPADRIALRKGEGYSLYVIPRGPQAGAPVELRWTVRSPPPGMRDPRSGVVDRTIVQTATAQVGKELRIGWQFDFDFQMIPGEWSLEVAGPGAKSVTHRFTAVAAP